MTPDLLEKLRQHANNLGYKSAPAYIRDWASAEVFSMDDRGFALNDASRTAIHYFELLLALRSPPAESPDYAIEYLFNKMRGQRIRKLVDETFRQKRV